MKTIRIILLALVLLAFVLAFTGCAVEETTTTTTDAKSGLVTVEKKVTKKADEDALGFASDALSMYAPPRRVRDEK